MTQKIINVGTVANDGTGDTIRGAFTNVNANFTEVYGNVSNLIAVLAGMDLGQNATIQMSYNTANAAFDQANIANTSLYAVGTAGNNYTTSVGAAGNSYILSVGAAGNSYTDSVGSVVNAYATSTGAASNAWANAVGTAGNNYTSVLVTSNAIGSNNWANTLTVSTYSWANTKFDTFSNTAYILTVANLAYAKANSCLPNTGNNLILTGNLIVTGSVTDAIGSVREKPSNIINSNLVLQTSQTIVIANNTNTIYINVENDGNFVIPANNGTKIEIFQYGSGVTAIRPNSPSVNIYSSNNWANIAGQYLSASLVKVQSNTWILTGDLKA